MLSSSRASSCISNLEQYKIELDEPILQFNEKAAAGKGCYGIVYRSKFKGARCVVKKLHDILTGKGEQDCVSTEEWEQLMENFAQEIELLSNQRHPNIVQFLGVYRLGGDPRDICLVMEQLSTDLKSFIEKHKGHISLQIKLSVLKDIACGMSYLHSRQIAHRDLNAGNVLLTTCLQAKVADLGVSRVIGCFPGQFTKCPGAHDYMPPEAAEWEYDPFKLDCFSIGHLMLYLAVEDYPVPNDKCLHKRDLEFLGNDQVSNMQVLRRKEWLNMLGNGDPLKKLIENCLMDYPEHRPDMTFIREQLEVQLLKQEAGKNLELELMLFMRKCEENAQAIAVLHKSNEEKEEMLKVLRIKTLENEEQLKHLDELHKIKDKMISDMTDEKKCLESQVTFWSKFVAIDRRNILNYNDQKLEIQPILSQELREGEKWYLVDQKWLDQWKAYVGYTSWNEDSAGDRSAFPGPVDNSNLFEDADEGILKHQLIEGLDYAVIPEAVWEKIVLWYWLKPGSRPICRRVIGHGSQHSGVQTHKHMSVEVYLLKLIVYVFPNVDDTRQVLFSRADSIEKVEIEIRRRFRIAKNVVIRLWCCYSNDSYKLIDDCHSCLEDFRIQTGQLLVVEKQSERNESWTTLELEESLTSSCCTAPGLSGLKNLHNSKFMNSILQCLSNTQLLTDYFLGDGFEKPFMKHINKANSSKPSLAESYGELLQKLWSASGKTRCHSPESFKQILRKYAPQFSGNQHNDSHEFFICLLSGLHEDLNVMRKKIGLNDTSIGKKMAEREEREDMDVAEETWHNFSLCNNSIITRKFQGLLKTTLKCPDCCKASFTFEPYMSLSIPLPKIQSVCVLLVRADPTLNVEKHFVTIVKDGPYAVHELQTALQRLTGIEPNKMIVAKVHGKVFQKVFDKDQKISNSVTGIRIYELTTTIENDDWLPIFVYMREMKSRRCNLFELPIVITVPKENCSYRQLYKMILRQISRYVIMPTEMENANESDFAQANTVMTEKDLFNLVVVDSRGTQIIQELNKLDDGNLALEGLTYVACDWEHETRNKYYDVKKAIEISQSRQNDLTEELTINDCLNQFLSEETLGEDNAWFCPNCNKPVQASKKADLWSLPDILVIHLKRFVYSRGQTKVNTKVDFPLLNMDFSQYIVNNISERHSAVYDLYAVNNHVGDIRGGDYTAYCKNKFTGNWYFFDNKDVSEICETSVCTSSSYILFYARQSVLSASIDLSLSYSVGKDLNHSTGHLTFPHFKPSESASSWSIRRWSTKK